MADKVKAVKVKWLDGSEEFFSLTIPPNLHPDFIPDIITPRKDGTSIFLDGDGNRVVIAVDAVRYIRMINAMVLKGGDKVLTKNGRTRTYNPLEDADHYEDELN